MKIGFVGLGRMGEGMARNLLKAGHAVVVYNRTASRCEALAREGARVANSPGEAAAAAKAAVTMLADDAAVEAVVFGRGGLLERLPKGSAHVSMSTIGVALSRRLAQAHAANGQDYVAAPVFGRPEAAAAAKLFVVAAGPGEALRRLEPLFAAVGQRTFQAGEEPAAANAVKLSGNFLLAAMIESFGEAFALARKHGIAPELFLDILTSTLFTAPAQKNYGGMIAKQAYRPAGFGLRLGLKDVRLALAAADEAGVPMPFASLLKDRFLAASARGWGDADWSALAALAAEEAGLSK